jgi:hypothetical protein
MRQTFLTYEPVPLVLDLDVPRETSLHYVEAVVLAGSELGESESAAGTRVHAVQRRDAPIARLALKKKRRRKLNRPCN